MKSFFIALFYRFVRNLLGSTFFEHIKELVLSQVNTRKKGDNKRKEVQKQVENLRKTGTNVLVNTVDEGLKDQAGKTSNRWVNLAIEVILVTLSKV